MLRALPAPAFEANATCGCVTHWRWFGRDSELLDRVSRQLNLRYEIRGDNVSIQPDTPFVRIYRVDYVNLSRQATTSSTVATNIASTSTEADGGGVP